MEKSESFQQPCGQLCLMSDIDRYPMISPHWTGNLRPLNGSLLAVSPRALNNMKKIYLQRVVVYSESPPIMVSTILCR